jgi:phage-related tail fiber protein
LNNNMIYIIAMGEPGSTLEVSLDNSTFTNFLPSSANTTADSSGNFQCKFNYTYSNVWTIIAGNPSFYKMRTTKDGKTSDIITWNTDTFYYCYMNNPGQNTATDMASFKSTLEAANNYCIKNNVPSDSILQSYP